MHPVHVIPGTFKLQHEMIQTEDQRFRFVREQVTRDWLTCGNLLLCKGQQPELLCCTFSEVHTRTQPALGPAFQDKRMKEPDRLGIQRQENMVHRRKVQDAGDVRVGL